MVRPDLTSAQRRPRVGVVLHQVAPSRIAFRRPAVWPEVEDRDEPQHREDAEHVGPAHAEADARKPWSRVWTMRLASIRMASKAPCLVAATSSVTSAPRSSAGSGSREAITSVTARSHRVMLLPRRCQVGG